MTMAALAYACVLTRNDEHLAQFYRQVLQTEPKWSGQYAEFSTGVSNLGLWSMQALPRQLAQRLLQTLAADR